MATGYDETGFTRPGGFADHVVVPARLLHPLADHADLRAATLLEPAALAAAAVRAGRPEPGERVAVVGEGTLGLLAVQQLAARSPAELTLVDPEPERAARARGFGASGACTPAMADEVHGRYDLVVETAGAHAAADACLLARRGGRVVLLGRITRGAAALDPARLSAGQLTLRGASGAPSTAWAYVTAAFTARRPDPAPLITHEFALDRFADALALVGAGHPKTGKVLLRP